MPFKCIKIGIRHNLIYPLMYLILINILRVNRIIIDELIDLHLLIIYPLLKFICTIILSSIILYLQNKHRKLNINTKIMGISLIKNQGRMKRLDREYKILILIFLSSYFDSIGGLRKYYLSRLLLNDKENKELKDVDTRIRSREIFFSSLLCYLTIRIKLYKHHKISLTIIFICLILSIIIEIIQMYSIINKGETIFYYIIMQFFIIICRVNSDIIDKYLFEFNYVDPFKALIYKGTIETLLILFFTNDLIEDIHKILEKKISIIMLLIYFIVSGFKTIYRILTVKIYSPMTRTLVDSFLDIFFNIYYYWDIIKGNEILRITCFWIDSFLKAIIIFFNCIFNELFVLYCYGMEKNTYLEITERAINIELRREDRTTIFSLFNE